MLSINFKTISTQFVLTTIIIVVVLLTPFSIFFISRYREAREQANEEMLREQDASLTRQAKQMSQFIARISPTPLMTQDLFSLKLYANEVLSDSNFIQIKFMNTTGTTLLDQHNEHHTIYADSAWADSCLKTFTDTIITSKEMMGVEQKVGIVTFKVSYAALAWSQKERLIELHKKIAGITWGLAGFAILLCAALSFGIFATLKKLLMQPLSQVTLRVQDIADGDGDLTQRLAFQKDNEMGFMASSIDAFIAKLQHLINSMSERFGNLDRNLGLVNQGAEQMVQTSTVMGQKSQEAAKSAKAVSNEVNRVVNDMDGLRGQFQAISVSMNEFTSTLGEISRSTALESQKAQEADSLTENAADIVGGLNEMVHSITGILNTIRAISNQTRLLALNATIEAASAGDAGKGFAVVASEVKDLARRTADSTEGIQKLVETIRVQMEQAVAAITTVREHVRGMKDASMTVSASMEGQAITLGSVTQRITEVNGLTASVNQSLSRSNQLIQDVTQNISELDGAVQSVETEIKKSRQNISDAGAVSKEVKAMIGKFKT